MSGRSGEPPGSTGRRPATGGRGSVSGGWGATTISKRIRSVELGGRARRRRGGDERIVGNGERGWTYFSACMPRIGQRATWLIAGALAGGACRRSCMWGFTVDDALISVRYARHLAAGVGWRFNAGGPEHRRRDAAPVAVRARAAGARADALVVLGAREGARARRVGRGRGRRWGAAIGTARAGARRGRVRRRSRRSRCRCRWRRTR